MVTILRTILSVNRNLRTNRDLRFGFWMAGGRALIPKNAFGWPNHAGFQGWGLVLVPFLISIF